jgi:hypothetical protein
VAKDDAQMSTAHLMGMLSGVGLISVSHEPAFLFSAFALLSPLNIYFTYKLLNTAQFEILNQAKLTLLSRSYIDTGKVVDVDDLKDREYFFGEWIKANKNKGPVRANIKLGAGADKAFGGAGEVERVVEAMRVSLVAPCLNTRMITVLLTLTLIQSRTRIICSITTKTTCGLCFIKMQNPTMSLDRYCTPCASMTFWRLGGSRRKKQTGKDTTKLCERA